MPDPVTSSNVEFAANGGAASGYMSRLQGEGRYPSIVLIQEWWGWTIISRT